MTTGSNTLELDRAPISDVSPVRPVNHVDRDENVSTQAYLDRVMRPRIASGIDGRLASVSLHAHAIAEDLPKLLHAIHDDVRREQLEMLVRACRFSQGVISDLMYGRNSDIQNKVECPACGSDQPLLSHLPE